MVLFLPLYVRYIVPHRINRFIKINTHTLMRYTLSSSSYTAPKRTRTHRLIDGLKCPEYKYYKNNDNKYSGYQGKGGASSSRPIINRYPSSSSPSPPLWPLWQRKIRHCSAFWTIFSHPLLFRPPPSSYPPLFLAASTSNANTSIPPPPDFVIIRVQ